MHAGKRPESEVAVRPPSELTAPKQPEVDEPAAGASNVQGSRPAERASRSAESLARWAFALLLLLGGAAAFAWFALASSRYATYEIRTHDPVSGLMADAPVEFHGVEVGRVARVELIDPGAVSVLLHIRKDAPVSTATVATVTSRGAR